MMPVRLDPTATRSQVKHSTTKPLRSHPFICETMQDSKVNCILMFKDRVMHKVKCLLMCHEETHESHLNVTGVQFFRIQI